MTETAEQTTHEPTILVTDLGDGVVRITLNRPRKRNALNPEARQALIDALQETRGKAKVLIINGAGGTFCSGMDLSQITDTDQDAEDDLNRSWLQVQEEIRHHPAVVIASAQGYALGGGSTLICVCDLAVVATDTQIGTPEIGFGFYPGLAGPAAQLRLSPKHAAWLILTAKRIDGQTAVDWGMANLAVDPADLEAETLSLARHIAQFDPVALEWSKKALWKIPMHISEWRTALEFGTYVNAQIHARTDSHQQALKNFAAGKPNPGQGRNA
jgi:enoyl-CoA hydratase/carnithine racemase